MRGKINSFVDTSKINESWCRSEGEILKFLNFFK